MGVSQSNRIFMVMVVHVASWGIALLRLQSDFAKSANFKITNSYFILL
jgi:hypothetical protein